MRKIFDISHVVQLALLHQKYQLYLIIAEKDRKLQDQRIDKTGHIPQPSLNAKYSVFQKRDHDRNLFQHHLRLCQLIQLILQNIFFHIKMFPWTADLCLQRDISASYPDIQEIIITVRSGPQLLLFIYISEDFGKLRIILTENRFLPLLFLKDLLLFLRKVFPVFFQPPFFVLFFLLFRIPLGQQRQQNRTCKHGHISGKRRRTSHDHRASHPHDERDPVLSHRHGRTVDLNGLIVKSKPFSRIAVKQHLTVFPFFRKYIAHNAVCVIDKSGFFRRDRHTVISVIDRKETAAHNDLKTKDIDHIAKIQLHGFHTIPVYIDPVR